MNDSEKLDLINTIKFVDSSADGETCDYVIVEDNKTNRDILHKIGFDDEYIKQEELIDEDGYINVAPIAFKYCNWWNGEGEYFENKDEDKWCSDCDIEFATYEYEGDLYCPECLLKILEEHDRIQSWSVQHYMIDGEYIGNDNDNDMEDIIKDIAKYLKIKKIEE